MEVKDTKSIQEAFSGAPIPSGAADFRVASLKVDPLSRSMKMQLSLKGMVPYREIVSLKTALRE